MVIKESVLFLRCSFLKVTVNIFFRLTRILRIGLYSGTEKMGLRLILCYVRR